MVEHQIASGGRAGGKWGPSECEQGPSMFLFLPHVGVFILLFVYSFPPSSACVGALAHTRHLSMNQRMLMVK
jgi:hypothetical protein